jgi:hypothetical protein
MIEKNLNLSEFVDQIRNQISQHQEFSIFNDTISFYDMSLGGCGCSKNTREKYAEDKYIEKIQNIDNNTLLLFKTTLGLSESDHLNFNKKDGTSIKSI